MEVLNNFLEYRKYTDDYKKWRNNQDLNYQKRIEYLRQHPDKMSNEDIQRGENLLHAIDVMDEYSQSNAEDMEVSTDMVSAQIISMASMLGMLGGFGLLGTKIGKNFVSKIARKGNVEMIFAQMIPSVVGMFVGFAASFPVIKWATEAKIGSSRRGRFEAMREDLSNPAIFATLTPEQLKAAKEKAKYIEPDSKIIKKIKADQWWPNPLEPFKVLKKMFTQKKEYTKQKQDFDNKIKLSDEENFNTTHTELQKIKAEKDKQILTDMVRKIDIASQDYAENTELATNTMTTLALAGGGLVGWISNKLLDILKVSKQNKLGKIIPYAVGVAIPLGFGIYGANVQKQASRIGRYKVKQEMLNNPESLVYVNQNDIDSVSGVKVENKKKPNIFKFMRQMIKDNKEYKQYRKTKLIEELKLHKATEKIDLSDKQLEDAKVLQMNVFKTFNKVDEKSQTYSESVEAIGKIAQQAMSVFGSLAASIASSLSIVKMLNNPESAKNATVMKIFTKAFTPFAFVLLPIIGFDIYTTKAQKKASRVADMLALKELNDYRHYAGYKDKNKNLTQVSSKETKETNLLKLLQMNNG